VEQPPTNKHESPQAQNSEKITPHFNNGTTARHHTPAKGHRPIEFMAAGLEQVHP
jgi:hypothetical protein